MSFRVSDLVAQGIIQGSSAYATIFYDSANTGYYVDPNSNSNIYQLTVNGDHQSGYGIVRVTSNNDSLVSLYTNNNATAGLRIQNSSSLDLIFVGKKSGSTDFVVDFGFTQSAEEFIVDSSGNTFSRTSSRAPIFYDSNDTTYYGDFAGTSNLNYLNLGNTREEFPFLRMGAAGRYALGVSGAYTRLSSHNQGSGVQLGYFDGTTFTPRLTAGNDGNVEAASSFRAPIFYDSQNTAYYLDPASTSNLNGLTVGGSSVVTNNGGTWGINITGSAGTLDGLDSTDFMRNYGMLNNTDVYVNFRVMRNSNSSSANDGMYIGYGNTGGGVTRLFGGGATSGELIKYSNYTYEPGSFRAPIFYDSENTAYYVDPASTSNLNGLTVVGGATITGPNAWNAATPMLNVGGTGDGRIQVRHIWGKQAGNAGTDHLWLQYSNTGNHVQIGDSGGGNNLYVSGNIYMNGYFSGNLVATQSWVTSQGYITGSYVPTAGGINMTGSYGLNDNKLYLRTNGDNNHYLWNASDDWEELNAYEGTGFRITSVGGTTGVLYVHGSSNGGYTYSPYSFRAPIFYDSNDTSFYVDPNSTSRIATLNTTGNITSDGSVAAYGLRFRNGTAITYCGFGGGELNNIFHTESAYGNLRHNDISNYEVSADGSSWSAGTLDANIYNLFLGERDKGGSLTIAASGVGRYQRFTFAIGYKNFDMLHITGSTNGENIYIKLEVSRNGGASYTEEFTSIWNSWPGNHSKVWSIFDSSITRLRLTIYKPGNNYSNSASINSINYYGGYAGYGERYHMQVYSYDYLNANISRNLYVSGNIYSNGNTVLHAGNYNSYAPTLTGGGASGTWGISITGQSSTTNSVNAARYVNNDFNTLGNLSNGFRAYSNYIPSGGSYNQPPNGSGDYRVYQISSPESAGNWGGQLVQNFYTDQMWFRRQDGSSWQAWRELIHDGNYTTWTIARGGDTVDGVINYRTNLGAYSGSLSNARLQVYNDNNQSAFMSFHRSGQYAVNFGLDQDNVMRIGGWSASANRWELDMSGNNTVAGSFRAPIFYDSQNTYYYVDPNSTSRIATLVTEGQIYINNGDPTIFLQDTNHRSAMLHCNSNEFYVLRGSGTNSTGWATFNGYWPLVINLENNDATFGRNISAPAGTITAGSSMQAPIFYDSQDTTYYADFANTGISIQARGLIRTWAGNSGSGAGWDTAIEIGETSAGTVNGSFPTYITGYGVNIRKSSDGCFLGLVTYDGGSNYHSVIGWGDDSGEQLQFRFNNGVVASMDYVGNYTANSSLRAPIFYDSNDTTYYADFANTGTSIYTAGTIRTSGMLLKGSAGGGQIYPTIAYGGMSIYGGDSLTNGAWITMTGLSYGSSPGAGSAEIIVRSEASSKIAMWTYNGSTYTGRAALWGSNGNFVIGSATTDYGYKLYVDGTIYATGNVIAYSDESVKTNVREIENPLARVLNTRGVIYDRIDNEDKDNIGFIAQELEKEFPELVSTGNNGKKGVMYQNMVAVLIEADIYNEMVNGGQYEAGGERSLGALSTAAGKSAPHEISEFYGYNASGGVTTYTANWTTGNKYGTGSYNEISMAIIKNGVTIVDQHGNASGSFTFTTSDSIELQSNAVRYGYTVRITHSVGNGILFLISDEVSKEDGAELRSEVSPTPNYSVNIDLYIN